MTAWTGTEYFNFAVDSLNDLTTSTFELGTVLGTYPVTAARVTDVDEVARLNAGCKPLPAGRTRFWWQALLGAGQTIELEVGANKIYARLTDSPEVLPFAYTLHTP